MHISARMIMAALLIGMGLATPKSVAQQTPATPDSGGKASQDASGPNPNAAGIYHPGKGVTPPAVIYSVDPQFTEAARKKKLGGTCIVSMIVDTRGTPQNVQIVEPIASPDPKLQSVAEGLNENAITAARQYRFKPGTYQGKPVPVEIKVEISYRIY
jgi:periplasmic protein TonB